MSLAGAKGANYYIAGIAAPQSLAAQITKAPVTISGLRAQDKTYDGNVTDKISGSFAVIGLIGADQAVASGEVTGGTFVSSNPGRNIAVRPNLLGLTLTGLNAANYEITDVTVPLTANITAIDTAPVIMPGIIQQLAADEGDGDNNFYSADWSSFNSANNANCGNGRADALITMSTPGAADEIVLAAINSSSMVKQELPSTISAMINNASLSASAPTEKLFASDSVDMTSPGILSYKLTNANGKSLPSWVKFDAKTRVMTLAGSAPDKSLPLAMRLVISRGSHQIIESIVTVKPIEGGACTAQTASKQ
jgi:hypothetical protein